MKYFVLGSTYVVRLDAGERIVEAIKALCERDAIGGGNFHGLGAVGEAEIGHFDPEANGYTWVQLSGPLSRLHRRCPGRRHLEGVLQVHVPA